MDILDYLLRQNPWWEKKKVESIEGYGKRKIFDEISKYQNDRQILSITGLRRTGKTTLVLQLIERLLLDTEPKNIIYFSFDEILGRDENIIEQVLGAYETEILRGELKSVYVFFDEINNIRDWQVFLKRYYDLNKKIKFVVTGSSSVLLKKAKESLAGRIYEFEMKPLSFAEYLELKNVSYGDIIVSSPTLKKEFASYMISGGFPEIASETDFEKIKKYSGSVLEKIIFHDIPKVYDVADPEVIKGMLSAISRDPGMIIDYQTFASTFGVTYQTVSKYMDYMEKAFLITRIYNYRGRALARSRKMKKAYLTTTTLASYFFDSEKEFLSMAPKMVENLVCIHIGAKFFMREYYEVDFIHDKMPYEVKYRTEPDIKNALEVAKKIKSKNLVVITKDTREKRTVDGIEVTFIPAWMFLLQ